MNVVKSRNLLVALTLFALLFVVNVSAEEEEEEKLPDVSEPQRQLQMLEQERLEQASRVPPTWRQKFKRARHNILLFNMGVNNYYRAVLFQGVAGATEKKMLIDGSIAARQSLDQIKGCPEECKEVRDIYIEIYENLRKMELMAENRQVAFNHLEKQKELKKKVDELLKEFGELLKLK